eukprot:gene12242-14343_t
MPPALTYIAITELRESPPLLVLPLSFFKRSMGTLTFVGLNLEPPKSFISLKNMTMLQQITFTNTPGFSFNGTVPFIDYPINTSGIYFRNCGLSKLPDLNMTVMPNQLGLQDNRIEGTLPEITLKTPTLFLDNNKFFGSVPDTYCRTFNSFSHNNLTGILPTCYLCHLANKNIPKMIKGNQFSNYNNSWSPLQYPPCSSLQITNVSAISQYSSLTITGVDLGWESREFWTNYTTFSTKIPNILFTDAAEIKNNGGFYININTTTPHQNVWVPITKWAPPIINGDTMRVSPYANLGYLFYTEGSNFPLVGKEDIGSVNISSTLGPYKCMPLSAMANFYECVVYGQIPENKYNFTITYNGQSASVMYTFKRAFPYITAVDPCPIAGGRVVLYGDYGTNFTGTVVTIGDLNCQIVSINSTIIICNLLVAGTPGIKNLTLQVNGINWASDGVFLYLEDAKSCPGDCSGHGRCDTGLGTCFCSQDWHGPSCSVLVVRPEPPVVTPNDTTIGNGTKFGFSLVDIREMTLGRTEARKVALGNWTTVTSDKERYTWTFSTTFEEATITYSVREFKVAENITFAGVTIPMSIGAIKLTANITGWRYIGSLNNLQLTLRTFVKPLDNSCGSTKINSNGGDSLNSLNYLTIERDGHTLYGRFLDRVLSDGRPTFSSTTILENKESSMLVGINLPFCRECILDPDDCGNTINKTKKAWLMPMIVTVSVVGALFVLVAALLVVKFNFFITFRGGFQCVPKRRKSINNNSLSDSS